MDNNYQLSRIHNYVAGLMSREDMHALEREALQDPFLQDAIDGYRLQEGVDTTPLSLLQKRLNARIAQRSLDKHRYFFSWQRLAVGLVAAVMFVVVCSLLIFRQLHSNSDVIKEVHVNAETDMVGANALRVQIVPETHSNARPLKGWDQFSRELDENLAAFPRSGSVDVKFDIVDGHATNIHVTGLIDTRFMEKVKETIHKQLRWEGDRAQFRLHVGAE